MIDNKTFVIVQAPKIHTGIHKKCCLLSWFSNKSNFIERRQSDIECNVLCKTVIVLVVTNICDFSLV